MCCHRGNCCLALRVSCRLLSYRLFPVISASDGLFSLPPCLRSSPVAIPSAAAATLAAEAASSVPRSLTSVLADADLFDLDSATHGVAVRPPPKGSIQQADGEEEAQGEAQEEEAGTEVTFVVTVESPREGVQESLLQRKVSGWVGFRNGFCLEGARSSVLWDAC